MNSNPNHFIITGIVIQSKYSDKSCPRHPQKLFYQDAFVILAREKTFRQKLPMLRAIRRIQKSKIGNVLLKPNTIKGDKSIFQSEQKVIEYVKAAISDAENLKSKLICPRGNEILHLFGQSSEKVRHLLNNFGAVDGVNYFEIGTYQGTSFVSANYGNNANPLVVDNWSEFGGPSFIFFQNTQEFIKGKYKLIWRDCWKIAPEEVIEKFGNGRKAEIYLYDAGHSYDDHYRAFTHYNDALEDLFVAIVDDYNLPEVQKGTQDAFRDLKYNVLFETILPARFTGDSENWWNGYYVAVIRKK